MAINQNDIDLAMYLLDQSIYTNQSLPARDAALVKQFIEALLEHQQRPAENVKSREWRAAIYRKLLDDPQALQQFTQQALEKFGPENLARMVAPQLQELILAQQIQGMGSRELIELLRSHNRLTDVLEYAMEEDEEWVRDHFGVTDTSEEDREASYNAGLEEGQQSKQAEIDEAYDSGYADGQRDFEATE